MKRKISIILILTMFISLCSGTVQAYVDITKDDGAYIGYYYENYYGQRKGVTSSIVAQIYGTTYMRLSCLSGLTWDQAQEFCRELGGHLVTIESAEEFNNFKSVFGYSTGTTLPFWCGAIYDNSFSWCTGDSFDKSLFSIDLNELSSNASKIAMVYDYDSKTITLMNHSSDFTLENFICEIGSASVDNNTKISIINAMQNAEGIKTKYIDAMREDVLSINVTNLSDANAIPEIEVEFDKEDFIEVGELEEVPTIQTEATGIAKQYELPIKGLQNGKIKVTAILKTEQETKEDTAEIIIRSPKVYNNNVELTFGKVLPYIENERMFVGAEKFFGLIGGSAQENGKTVTGTHNDVTLIYNADSPEVDVNDKKVRVKNIPSVNTTAEGEKIYIPLRFTAENYDGYVQWNNDEYAAYITDDERSAYVSKIKKYCYDYPDTEKYLYFAQQDAYDTLINNDLYLSYLFMKEYSEIDTSSLSAFMADVTKKGIINITALVFNDEMWTRLWNYLKASHIDPTMITDGIDEIEKEKYKDALKSYIESSHQKRTTDKLVEAIDNITDPLKSAKGSISAATSPIKLDLKIEASADDLRETRKMLTDLGVSSDLSDVSDYAKNVDNILDEFDTLSAVGTVSDIAGWGFILTDGLSDMMRTLGNYNTMNEYVAELDSMANNTSLPTSLREAAKELKAEISGNIDDAIRAPLKRMFDVAGEELSSDDLKTIASGTGATVAAQIFAGVSIAKFIGNLTAGVDDVIKNISYVQMWGLLQEAELEKLNSLASEFNKLYKAEKDIDEVYAAAEKVEESYKRLHNYRLQGEQTYRYLQSGDYAVIDLQSLIGSGDSVEYADSNIKMLNDISFK